MLGGFVTCSYMDGHLWPHIHTKFYVLGNFSGFLKWQNSISGSDKTEIFIYRVPCTIHSLVELIHNSANAKEQKNWTNQCLQKRALKLVSSLPEHNKVEDFLFLTICNHIKLLSSLPRRNLYKWFSTSIVSIVLFDVFVVSGMVGEPTKHFEGGDDGGRGMARALK